MTSARAILPPSGLSRLVDVTIDSVWIGVRRFWRGGQYANAPAGQAISLLNRLMRILRFVFVILAVHVEPMPLRPRQTVAKRARRVRLSKAAFPLFPRYCIRDADAPKRAQPKAFAAPRDRFLIAQRKLEALTRALSNPMPLIRRMARALPTQLMVFGWRPPKRPPPTDRRDFWEDLIACFTEAKFTLGEWRRRTRDIPNDASGSERSGEREACADE